MRRYLLVIDMQKDFINGSLGTKEAQAIIPNVVQRIRKSIEEGRQLLFTQDTHSEDYLATSEGRHLPVLHCQEGTEGWRLHDAIAPYAKETLQKPSFGYPELATILKKDKDDSGVHLDISIVGLCTDICIVANAILLRCHFPESTLRVYANCCAGVTPDRHDAALKVLEACQIEVVTGDD